ncbi:GAF domain-containing sensor histidine kinase [Paenibacillus methanolicus]|uniref:histidine kinase n=1 Tax=Paenibacillus methanolicus TaxID=582686 RepID=A0A5S5CIK9_9BACL|nr:histidine kinase [Paenibacillus methanolicus]TYP78190.1 histidine kinase/DNA gyrase B/HSP90-like ATPase [Paenibacillus methanolicus]
MKTTRIYMLLVTVFFLATAALYINCIPNYYHALIDRCITSGCGLSVPALGMEPGGMPVQQTALWLVLIDVSFTMLFYASAAIILWKGGREPMGLLGALALVAFGTTFPSLVMVGSEGTPLLKQWFMGVSTIAWSAVSLFCLLFPNGTFVPRWSRYAFVLIMLQNLINFFSGGSMWEHYGLPIVFQFVWFLSTVALLIYSQVHRFRNVSTPEQRQQTKWVVYGVSVTFIGFAIITLMFSPVVNDGSATMFIWLNAALHMTLAALPITLTLALLRRRLWDINPLVNRTIVYGALTLAIVLLYAASVLYLGKVLNNWNPLVVSFIVTALVAVAFAPIKEWLQRQVNRMLKGRHDDPYAVLLELGVQMAEPLAPEAMLEVIAGKVKEALRLPYVGVAIGVEGQETVIAEAGEGRGQHELQAFPVVHRGRALGTVYAASRSPGEAFSAEDNLFLEVLLRHAGPLVNNADMLQAMRKLAEDLQESREKLVLAREEERRQIRNNLHDDLAPRLAALALNAATARKFVERDPAAAIAMLDELRSTIRSTVGDIRTLVHDLRPPALDELGLVGAIRTRMDELSKPALLLAGEENAKPLRFELDVEGALPALRAAVEVAVYRIVTESMVNTVKHANATVCRVQLAVMERERLYVEIRDDGASNPQHPIWSGMSSGIGLMSMRERAAEIGGECGFERLETGGMRVWAQLPLNHTEASKDKGEKLA